MILKNITITNATAEYGGAIYNKGTLTITNSTLNNNNARSGGAIENVGTLTVTYSTLNNNKAENGGAIDNTKEKYFDIIGCNFTQNHATERGGAIYSPGI